MISVEYLAIMCKKAMEEATTKIIRETRRKESEKNKVKIYVTYFIIDEHGSQRATTRNAIAYFECNWSTTIVKEVGQHMHEHL
jgi:hypothetical protein